MQQSSNHMERMIMAATQKSAPEIMRQHRETYTVKHHVQYKKVLLQQLLDTRGPKSVFGLAKQIPENSTSAAIFYLLLNSASPLELMQKLCRYDKHLHSNCQLELYEYNADYIVIDGVSRSENKPTAAEDLFLCGLIMHVMEQIGCQDLEVEWQSVRSDDAVQMIISMGHPPPHLDTNTRWRFHWRKYHHRGVIAGLDEFIVNYGEPFNRPKMTSFTDMVERILLVDLSHRPSIDEIARMLDMSVRQFQRKMCEEGVTYTRLFNDLRIKQASRLLCQSNCNMTEIGLSCGFKDSSHFSREFKKAQQMTPTQYRKFFNNRHPLHRCSNTC